MAKKELLLKQIKFIAIFVSLIIVFLFLGYTISRGYINKTSFEKDVLTIAKNNEKIVFTIDNITLFSSANATGDINRNSNLKLSNLYQYTDIAIFINSNIEDLNYENTLKEVYIDNINYTKTPDIGTPKLYYKNINDFASAKYSEENLITDNLHFNISAEEKADLNIPTLYNNCANPITLCYINDNIKNEYTLSNSNGQFTYDGTLLKKCNVPLSSISCELTFDIHIVNNLSQNFICPVYLKIPLESDDGSSIYDGKILLKQNTNYSFYKIN